MSREVAIGDLEKWEVSKDLITTVSILKPPLSLTIGVPPPTPASAPPRSDHAPPGYCRTCCSSRRSFTTKRQAPTVSRGEHGRCLRRATRACRGARSFSLGHPDHLSGVCNVVVLDDLAGRVELPDSLDPPFRRSWKQLCDDRLTGALPTNCSSGRPRDGRRHPIDPRADTFGRLRRRVDRRRVSCIVYALNS